MGLVRRHTVVLVVALTALLGLSLAASAAAEEIAYYCDEDLCLVDPDNPTDQSHLTETSTASERNPVWSPSGDLIAYNGLYPRPGNEYWDVYTIDPAEIDPEEPSTGEGTAVSETGEYNEAEKVDWSADGTLLAFTSRRNDNAKTHALVGRADGAADPVPIGLSTVDNGRPQFGPDSSFVAYFSGGSLYTAPSNGSGSPTPLNIASYGDDWSPDGRSMAGLSHGSPDSVFVTAVDGSGSRALPVPASSGTEIDWSCDSSRVAYVADEEPLDHVRVAPVDGSGPGVQIPLPEGWYAGDPAAPVFSPDGTRVAFGLNPLAGGYNQIFVAPADGSAVPVQVTKQAANAEAPSWKPGPACAAMVPPPAPAPPGAGTAPGTGSGGTGTIPATKTPVKLKFVYFKQPTFQLPHFMTIAGIDCNAQGGHPTGEVAEICAANASVYARGESPAGRRPWARAKGGKEVLLAKGQVKVPVGKSKKLRLKITAAGQSLLKPGRTLTLTVKLVTKQGSAKPVKSTKTLTAKVPAKKK